MRTISLEIPFPNFEIWKISQIREIAIPFPTSRYGRFPKSGR
jgi:hypothetical protein